MKTTTSNLSGVITALVTPFLRGAVDYRSFSRLVQAQLASGIGGLVVNGTPGESPTLTLEEVSRLFEIAKAEAAGAVPVLLGTGSNSTTKTIEMTGLAAKWGADAALVVTPYYNKPPQRGLVAHFRAVADATDIPIVLYNVPSRTISALSVETVAELSRHPRIVGIKEATGDLGMLKALRAAVAPDFILTSGDDASCVEFALDGGVGVISVVSHIIAEELTGLIARARGGDKSSRDNFSKYKRLLNAIYIESNPIPVKAALYIMGQIDSPEVRLPLVRLDDKYMGEMKQALAEIGK